MGWGQFKKKAQTGSSGGRFVRLQDGQSVTVVVLGDPMERWSLWTGSEYQDCEPSDADARRSFLMNVWDIEEQALRIFEANAPTFVDLADCLDEVGQADAEKLTIKRAGTGTKTRYFIRPGGAIPARLKGKLDAEQLFELSEFGGRKIAIEDERADPGPPDEETPF